MSPRMVGVRRGQAPTRASQDPQKRAMERASCEALCPVATATPMATSPATSMAPVWNKFFGPAAPSITQAHDPRRKAAIANAAIRARRTSCCRSLGVSSTRRSVFAAPTTTDTMAAGLTTIQATSAVGNEASA